MTRSWNVWKKSVGILARVDWSEWVTPIVSVMKKNGAVRVYGDFKVTINPVLQTEQYPLSHMEDIFLSLARGKKFSKLGLADAHLQIEMEEGLRVFPAISTEKDLFQYN